MAFRTVILSKDSKISLRMKHLVVKNENLVRIPIHEISTVIIENPNILMSGHILNALTESKVLVILCDKYHLPSTIIEPIYGHHRQSKNIKKQIKWTMDKADFLWKRIIEEKIRNQSKVLNYYVPEYDLDSFKKYSKSVELGDISNREGHAAKVYFRQLFGDDFIRHYDDIENVCLNYGYALISSAISRSIKSKGYLTEVGIKHMSEYNQQNLTSDLMEVFRPLVDYWVRELDPYEFGKEEKRYILDLLNTKINIKGKNQYFLNAVEIYLDGIFRYMEHGEEKHLVFPLFKFN